MSVRTHIYAFPWALILAQTTAGALALALLAKVRIPLPFTPVPVTLQVLGVLLLGGLLGPRVGTAAVVQYLIFGACGLPVFSGWNSALNYFSAHNFTTIGYLLMFVPAAAVYGALRARCRTSAYGLRLTGGLAAGLLAVLLTYLGGWAWLAYGCHLGAGRAIVLGIIPFIVGDLYKISIAATVLALRAR